MLMTLLPAAFMVLWFIMFAPRVCFGKDQSSRATARSTWAHAAGTLDGCPYAWETSPHTPGEQLSRTQAEGRMGLSADRIMWSQDCKWKRRSWHGALPRYKPLETLKAVNRIWQWMLTKASGMKGSCAQQFAPGPKGPWSLWSLQAPHRPKTSQPFPEKSCLL